MFLCTFQLHNFVIYTFFNRFSKRADRSVSFEGKEKAAFMAAVSIGCDEDLPSIGKIQSAKRSKANAMRSARCASLESRKLAPLPFK